MEIEEKRSLVERSEENFYTFRGKPVRVLGYGHARAQIYVTFEAPLVEREVTAMIGTTEWDTVAYVAKYEHGVFSETDLDVETPLLGDVWLITEGANKGKMGRVLDVAGQACMVVVETYVTVPVSALALVRRR